MDEANDKDDPPRKRQSKKRYLKIPEAAEEINCSERHVWREIETGQLKSHRFGGCTRISREDLYDYIQRSQR